MSTPHKLKQERELLGPSDPSMLDMRRGFAPLFWGLIVSTIVLLVANVGVIIFVFLSVRFDDLEKVLIAKLVQVSLGMLLGASCIFLGVLLIWLGIAAPLTLNLQSEAEAVKGNLVLKTASPGVALSMGGIVLIGVSLYRPVDYSRTSNGESDQRQGQAKAP